MESENPTFNFCTTFSHLNTRLAFNLYPYIRPVCGLPPPYTLYRAVVAKPAKTFSNALMYILPWCVLCLQVLRTASQSIVSQYTLQPSALFLPTVQKV